MKENMSSSRMKVNKVRYRTALVLIVSSMIGVGYLTLPSVLKESGLILGMLIIIICSIVSLFGSYQITRAFQLFPTENYPQLMEKVAGKNWRTLLTWDLFFYLLFSNTMFIYFSNLKSFAFTW